MLIPADHPRDAIAAIILNAKVIPKGKPNA
jgi:hypothetical protein